MMHYDFHIFRPTTLLVYILIWIVYFICAVMYLKVVSRKYLVPVSKDDIIGSKTIKDHKVLQEQYAGRESVNVLVLSGGGLRGLVPLETLSYLERKTGKKCGELFDFIAGSSTGSISAAGFCVADDNGNYMFSAQDITDMYFKNSHLIFSSPWYHQFLTMFGLFAPRFLSINKLKVLDQYVGNKTIGELKGNLLIPVYNIDQNSLQIVKNWNTHNHELDDNFLVKDLVNGASNPPMLFTPIAFKIKTRNYLFIDPGILLNNPILHILLHVRSLLPHKHINLILIGNGSSAGAKYSYRHMFSFGLYGMYQYLFSAPALNNKLYVDFIEDYLSEADRIDPQITFYRVNATPDETLGMSDPSLDNLERIRRFGKKMLQQNLVTINKIADSIS